MKKSFSRMDAVFVILAVAHFFSIFFIPDFIVVLEKSEEAWMIIARSWVLLLLYCSFGLVLFPSRAILMGKKSYVVPSIKDRLLLYCAGVLCGLPVLSAVQALKPLLSPFIHSNVLFYAPILLIVLILQRFFSETRVARPPQLSLREVWGFAVIAWIVFSGLGIYFTSSLGPHSGDEGHYITQAVSLYEDGDFDIRNNLEPPLERPVQYHISPNARNGKWYSWHSFGLSLLMAPFEGGGFVGRHICLGLISGLGFAGMLLLCRSLFIPRKYALTGIFLFATSSFWAIYSCRALPEVLGAVLTIFLIYALLLYPYRPKLSILLTVLCAGYMPLAQTRFIPIALLCASLFFLRILLRPNPRRVKCWHSISFIAALGAMYLAYWIGMLLMYEHASSYPVDSMLFSDMTALLINLFRRGSIICCLPTFPLMFCASFWLLFCAHTSRVRLTSALSLLLFMAIFLTSCSTFGHTGGASLAGRYLFVVTPPLVVLSTAFLPRASSFVLSVYFFAALDSCAKFFVMLFKLPHFHNEFADPTSGLVVVFGSLSQILDPFLDPFAIKNLYVTLWVGVALWVFMAACIFSGLRKRILWPSLGIFLLLAAMSHAVNLRKYQLNAPLKNPEHYVLSPRKRAHALNAHPMPRGGTLFAVRSRFFYRAIPV